MICGTPVKFRDQEGVIVAINDEMIVTIQTPTQFINARLSDCIPLFNPPLTGVHLAAFRAHNYDILRDYNPHELQAIWDNYLLGDQKLEAVIDSLIASKLILDYHR